jgi:predicted transcriptional regulator
MLLPIKLIIYRSTLCKSTTEDHSVLAQVKRAYFDIVANLLDELSQQPCGKTRLAARANLDTRATRRYINLLLATNLVSYDANILNVTTKGFGFLEEYKKLKLFLEQ